MSSRPPYYSSGVLGGSSYGSSALDSKPKPTYSRHFTSTAVSSPYHSGNSSYNDTRTLSYSNSASSTPYRSRSLSNASSSLMNAGSSVPAAATPLSSTSSSTFAIQRKPLSAKTSSQQNITPALSTGPRSPPPLYELGEPASVAKQPTDTRPPLSERGRIGLSNLGNTCYMNSILQCLSHSRLLLELVQHEGGDGYKFSGGRVAGAFSALMKELWSSDTSSAVRPTDLKASMGRYASRFAGYGQQDSEEFLRYLLEALHEDTNRVPRESRPRLPPVYYEELDKLSDQEKADTLWQRYRLTENSPIVDIFVGQLKSTLECCHCRHKSTTFDPFWDLALPIANGGRSTSLRSCLELFTAKEDLDGDEKPVCEGCKTRRRCYKSFSLYRLPRILVIHLVRFSGERYKTKLNTLVDYPLELDLTEFMDQDCKRSQQNARYTLYAVSEHSGTPYGGHYTATVRHAYAPTTWLAFNDSRVSPSSFQAACSSQGYVLFYEASAPAL